MSDGTLKVNTQVLQTAGTSFGQAKEALANMQVDVPLTDAAGVGNLQTAGACRKAQAELAAATKAAIEGLRKFSDNLNAAARMYGERDSSAADVIRAVQIPE